jgi:isopenicillin-N epimerase
MPSPAELRPLFLLDPDVIFLNHGSYGACPRPVFEAYQNWQLTLERQPVKFLGRAITDDMAEARARLAAYIGCAADEVVYFPNPTTAINMVARSLRLAPGDEVLTTDHEYGAMDRTWRYLCGLSGAVHVRRPIPVPVTTAADFIENFWGGVTARTKVIFLSQLTSATALVFPVEEICRRARAAGIVCIVDGAHIPAQLPLNLDALGADFYTGACHKWLCAPKGSAFLYARRSVQPLLGPLVVSWGWEAEKQSASLFVDHHEWQGTRDPAAFLATPAAIDFQAAHDWNAVRADCHARACATRRRITALTGLAPLSPDSAEWIGQLVAMPLPPVNVEALKTRLYDEFHIEIPVYYWNHRPIIRLSVQGYNTEADLDALVKALTVLLPQVRQAPEA